MEWDPDINEFDHPIELLNVGDGVRVKEPTVPPQVPGYPQENCMDGMFVYPVYDIQNGSGQPYRGDGTQQPILLQAGTLLEVMSFDGVLLLDAEAKAKYPSDRQPDAELSERLSRFYGVDVIATPISPEELTPVTPDHREGRIVRISRTDMFYWVETYELIRAAEIISSNIFAALTHN